MDGILSENWVVCPQEMSLHGKNRLNPPPAQLPVSRNLVCLPKWNVDFQTRDDLFPKQMRNKYVLGTGSVFHAVHRFPTGLFLAAISQPASSLGLNRVKKPMLDIDKTPLALTHPTALPHCIAGSVPVP